MMPKRWPAVTSLALAWISASPAQPLQIAAGAGGGSAFTAPADPTQSLSDFQEIDVRSHLEEFLEINADLFGSVSPRNLSLEAARRALQASYDSGEARRLRDQVRAEPRLSSPASLQAAAATLYAQGRGGPAFLCLLLAAEQAPTDPGVLLNLAAGALAAGRANEALPLLGAATAAGPLPAGPWGLGGDHYHAYLRAYAQALRGEYVAARGPLQQLVDQEPGFSEAALLLALVQARLGEEPRVVFLRAMVRKRAKFIARDHDPETVAEARAGADGLVEGETVVPSLADLYDLSAGRPGSIPNVPRPRTAVELMGMLEPYMLRFTRAQQEQVRLHNEVAGAAYRRWADSSGPAAYRHRQTGLYNRAVSRFGGVPELDRVAHEVDLLRRELDAKTETLIAAAMEQKMAIIQRQAEADQGRPMTPAILRRNQEELNGPADDALGSVETVLAQYHDAVGREYLLRSAMMHGMLSVIGAPEPRAALQATAEEVRHEAEANLLSAVMNLSGLLGAIYDPKNVALEEGKAGSGPSCTDEQSRFSVSLEVGPAGVEINCSSVSLELQAELIPGVLGVSGEVGLDLSGEITGFIGPKESIPGVGSYKEGLYVKAGREGLRDIGVKVEAKASTGVGPVSTSYKVGEMAYSFVPSPRTAGGSGALPDFSR